MQDPDAFPVALLPVQLREDEVAWLRRGKSWRRQAGETKDLTHEITGKTCQGCGRIISRATGTPLASRKSSKTTRLTSSSPAHPSHRVPGGPTGHGAVPGDVLRAVALRAL